MKLDVSQVSLKKKKSVKVSGVVALVNVVIWKKWLVPITQRALSQTKHSGYQRSDPEGSAGGISMFVRE